MCTQKQKGIKMSGEEIQKSSYMTPQFTAGADYAKRMAQWEEEHAKKLKKENTQMLSNMIAGMTTSCTNIYTTKYAINDIASIKYHLSCNPNCDSAIYDKVAKLQSQESILQQKYLEFQQNKDKKDNYTVQTNINRDVSIFNLDRAV